MSWAGGDWMCGACEYQNFKKREACQRCGYPKFGGPDASTYLHNNRTEVLAGDWYCSAMNCGAHNYAGRTSCYRCGGLKFGYSNDSGFPPGWKSGDWICARVGCGVHNYASRMECFKCKTPRDFVLDCLLDRIRWCLMKKRKGNVEGPFDFTNTAALSSRKKKGRSIVYCMALIRSF